jgi:NhaA family Na+:H+ antiporter
MVTTPARRCSHPERGEDGRVAHILRKETDGGGLLLLATVVALVWANTAFSDSYFQLVDTEIRPAALHLNLTVAQWVGDGLLAVLSSPGWNSNASSWPAISETRTEPWSRWPPRSGG